MHIKVIYIISSHLLISTYQRITPRVIARSKERNGERARTCMKKVSSDDGK